MNKTKKNLGFSLIELVVVITIMAVITALVSINFASAGKRGRDSRRMADLEKIRVALEMMRQVGATYPAGAGAPPTSLTPDYIQAIPTDPKSGGNYYYNQVTDYTYVLRAKMEDLGSTTGNYPLDIGATNNYEVKNP